MIDCSYRSLLMIRLTSSDLGKTENQKIQTTERILLLPPPRLAFVDSVFFGVCHPPLSLSLSLSLACECVSDEQMLDKTTYCALIWLLSLLRRS